MSSEHAARPVKIRQFSRQREYTACWQQMQAFTRTRSASVIDEVWLLEHEPVFTLGIRESENDILDTGNIPLVKTDRGGLVTYHGPGQLIVYLMLDLRRLGMGLRALVGTLEQVAIDMLAGYGIHAERMENAPGVYVDGRKIASLALRVQRGCTYHGLSLNVDMDLSPFDGIVPCGLGGMKMTDMKTLGATADIDAIGRQFVQVLSSSLGYTPVFENHDDSTHYDDQ